MSWGLGRAGGLWSGGRGGFCWCTGRGRRCGLLGGGGDGRGVYLVMKRRWVWRVQWQGVLFVIVFGRGCVSGVWLVQLMELMMSRVLRLASGGRCMDG